MVDSARARRVAIGLWLALGIAVWNVVFDYEIRTAADVYLYRRTLYARSVGPPVTIDAVMRPAVTRGAALATALSAAVTSLGLGAIHYAGRRHPPADPLTPRAGVPSPAP